MDWKLRLLKNYRPTTLGKAFVANFGLTTPHFTIPNLAIHIYLYICTIMFFI